MKKTKFFFFRLDIPKKICLIAFAPLFYVTLWTWIGMRFGFILVPLFVIDFIVCLIPVRVPGEKEIERMLSSYYEDHRTYITNKADKSTKKTLVLLKGFSDVQDGFKRKIGSRFIFPVCRTLAFAFKEDKALVYLRDSALWEGEECIDASFEISKEAPAKVTRLSYEDGTNVNLFSFTIGDKSFQFYIQNRFELKELVEAHRDFFAIDASEYWH